MVALVDSSTINQEQNLNDKKQLKLQMKLQQIFF